MNYTSLDTDEKGNLTPRGEICMRGLGIFSGYYKNKEKTDEILDSDGWLHTGDVGLINPNGSLKVIDRKKNIFKLAQGEYIAPEKIENVYLAVSGVGEIFVYGNSLKSYLVAIVVPDKAVLENFAKANNIEGDFEELCKNKKVNEFIMKNMNDEAKKRKLFGFEQVKVIYLEPKSFILHEITSSTFKVKRNEAKKKFESEIEKLYAVDIFQK